MKNVTQMTNEEFKGFVQGKFFSVDFIKKSGELRTYKGCRVDVKKFTKGGYNNVEHKQNLVTVHTPHEKRPHSTLNLETVKRITFQGETQFFK